MALTSNEAWKYITNEFPVLLGSKEQTYRNWIERVKAYDHPNFDMNKQDIFRSTDTPEEIRGQVKEMKSRLKDLTGTEVWQY